MLARALEQHGDDIETERLYDWLAAVMPIMPSEGALELSSLVRRHLGADTPEEDIRSRTDAWLRDRPSKQKELIREIVRRQDGPEIVFPTKSVSRTRSLTVDDVLAGAPVADFAPWFLEQAVSLSESRPQLACHMLHMLHRTGMQAELLDERRMPWEKKAGPTSTPEAPPRVGGLTLDQVAPAFPGTRRSKNALNRRWRRSPSRTRGIPSL